MTGRDDDFDPDDAILDGDYEVERTVAQSVTESSAVVACRHCRSEFDRVVAFDDHKYQCTALQLAEQATGADTHADDANEDTTTDSLDDLQRTYFIDPGYHEFKAYVKYDVGLDAYYGLNSLQKEHSFADDGALLTTFNGPDGREWELQFSFKASGLEPWHDASFRLETVREYVLKIHPPGVTDHSDALEKATFTVSPRWPGIRSQEGYSNPSNPHDITGIQATFDGSNIPFEDYPGLFYRAMAALQGEQGTKWSNPTYIPYEEVAPERIHHSSNIVDAELYVRIDEGLTGPLYAIDGPLHRLSLLLSNERRGYAKTIRDDRECAGYYHVATIDSERASEFLGGHVLGKEFKHYHVNNPDAVDGDGMLEHPKVGVALQHSVTDRTVYWDDLGRLERELDEALLNTLDYADIPLRPDGQVYVADDVFDVTGSRRFRKLVPDQLPSLRQEQAENVTRVVNNLAPTDADIAEELVTDGGNHSPQSLAETLGRHIDTVYRSLKRLGDLVIHEYGDVRLRSQHVAQQILAHLRGAKESFDVSLGEAADKLLQAERVTDGESAFARWRQTYGVEFDDRTDDADRLRMKYRPESKAEVRRILRTGARRWGELTGNKPRRFAVEVQPEVELADGTTYAPQRWSNTFGIGSGPNACRQTFG